MACQSLSPGASSKSVENITAPSWTADMKTLQVNLAEIEPFLYDSTLFNAPKNQDILKEKIHLLAVTSKNINHNPTIINRDPTVRFIASQFSQNLQKVEQSFRSGKTEYARYQLMKVTSSCVHCHTRIQQGPEFTTKTSEVFLKNMPKVDQAEYLIASRRFDEAYDILLKVLETPETDNIFSWSSDKAAGLALLVAVQYKQNYKQALKIVRLIEYNKSLPYYLKTKANNWKQSIDAWIGEKKKPTSIPEMRALLENGKSEIEAMRVIPGILKLLSMDQAPQQLGESLLLAGESYELINDILPMEIHENYYESCIKNVPHSPISKKCYKRLEESIKIGYSGSSGTNIPVEVEIWLNKLKEESEKF